MEPGIFSFENLYSDYIPRMIAFVSTFRGLREDEIDDLAHDILVHAWFKKNRYDISRPLNAWIYALARNYVIDYLRSKKPVLVPLDERTNGTDARFGRGFARLVDPAIIRSADDEARADSGLIGLIKNEILSMDDRDRQIAMLIFFERMSGADASRIMGIPGATVRWRLAVIRRRLQNICREAP